MNRLGHNWHRWVLVTLVCAGLCYVVVLPLVEHWVSNWMEQSEPSQVALQSPIEIINQRLMEGLFAGLFFSFGAALGSFLNVVAYRMPLKRSIVFEPSKCPRCRKRISARDNFPVFGWFMLKGKCRNCQLPISARYPIVEAIVGSIFLVFYFRELISGGMNLPLKDLSVYHGVVWIVLDVKWDLLAIYAYHCAWLIFLMVWTLFAWDANRIPTKAIGFALLALLIPPLAYNDLVQVPVDYYDGQTHWTMSPLANTALSLAVGSAAGVAIALISKSLLLPALSGFRSPSSEELFASEAKNQSEQVLVKSAMAADVQAMSDTNRQFASLSEVANPQELGVSAEPAEFAEASSTEIANAPETGKTTEFNDVEPPMLEPRLDSRPSSSTILQESVFACSICTGIAVGWQALAVITLAIFAWRVMCWIGQSENVWNSLPFAGWFLVAAFNHQLFWRTLVKFW